MSPTWLPESYILCPPFAVHSYNLTNRIWQKEILQVNYQDFRTSVASASFFLRWFWSESSHVSIWSQWTHGEMLYRGLANKRRWSPCWHSVRTPEPANEFCEHPGSWMWVVFKWHLQHSIGQRQLALSMPTHNDDRVVIVVSVTRS